MIQKIFPTVVWLAAFLCSLFFINAWQLELFACAVIIIFIWAVFSLSKNKEWQVPSSWALRLMAAFWLLVFISVLGSDILSVSLMAFCLFSVMPLSFLVFTINASQKDFVFTAKVLSFIYAGLAVCALAQFFVFPEYFNGRAAYPLANPNSLAALFSLGFFCAVGWMLGMKERRDRYLALCLSILLFGGIMAAGSRGVLFTAVPVLGVFLFFMRSLAKENVRLLCVLAISCVVLFFLTSLGLNATENLFDRVVADTQAQGLNDFTNNRISLWAASWEMIKAHGVFGTGIGTYFLYFPEFRLSDDLKGAYYAHNDPLQYWVELGILGPVLFYAFVISIIGRTVQAVKKTVSDKQKLLILTPFFALGACIIHTHVTFNLYNLSILFTVGFLLSVWFYATQKVLNTKSKKLTFPESYAPATRAGFIALPFIVIGVMFVAYIAGEHYNNKARDYLLAGELEPFASNVVLAQKIGFNGNYRPYLLAVNVPLSLLEEAEGKLDLEKKQELTKIALNYIQHVRRINPRSSSALYYMGKLQQTGVAEALPKTLESAEYYYAEAIQIDPLHIGARLALAKILQGQGSNSQALKLLEQGAKYKYSSMNAMDLYATLVRYYLSNGDAIKRDMALKQMHGFQRRIERQKVKDSNALGQNIWGN